MLQLTNMVIRLNKNIIKETGKLLIVRKRFQNKIMIKKRIAKRIKVCEWTR